MLSLRCHFPSGGVLLCLTLLWVVSVGWDKCPIWLFFVGGRSELKGCKYQNSATEKICRQFKYDVSKIWRRWGELGPVLWSATKCGLTHVWDHPKHEHENSSSFHVFAIKLICISLEFACMAMFLICLNEGRHGNLYGGQWEGEHRKNLTMSKRC